MATLTINSTTPSTSVNLNTLKSVIDKILTADRTGGTPLRFAQDELAILTELRYAVTTNIPTSTYTVSSITVTYS